MVKKVETYGLDKKFEIVVAIMSATNPRFWGRIGSHLDPAALESASCRLVLKTVRQIAKDTGRGPTSDVIVLQRLRRQMSEGSVTQEQIDSVIDLFLRAPHRMPSEEDVVAELVPVLRRRMQAEAVRDAMDEFARKGDFDSVVKKINKARALGAHDESLGLRLGPEALGEIRRLQHLDRLPYGIPELDAALDGGLPRACVNLFIGGTGAGKSMALSHVAATAVRCGYFVLVATLEISQAAWQARVIANVLGVPINHVMSGDQEKLARDLGLEVLDFGTMIVKEFSPKITTIPDIWSWVLEAEENEGIPADLVVIDYIDKLRSHDHNDRNEYSGQGTVMEGFRTRIHASGKWGHTASQAKRRDMKQRKVRLESDDAADSQHKIRVTDHGITLNPESDGEQILFHVAKNRYGKAGFSVGPLPHDFDCGRLVHW